MTEVQRSPFTLENRLVVLANKDGKLADLYMPENEIFDAVGKFSNVYYTQMQRTWGNTFYHGVLTCQSVADLWVYQELIFAMKPDLIVECGTGYGGCTLWFAHILDNMKSDGRIITIDVDKSSVTEHPRITKLIGRSIDKEILSHVRRKAKAARSVMVFLDSDHSTEYVIKEMEAYSKFVKEHGYMIVEDTNCVGPGTALIAFLGKHDEFFVDPGGNKFYQTFCPNGFLQKKGNGHV